MPVFKRAALSAAASCLIAWQALPVAAQEHSEMPNTIAAAKLIIGDVTQNQAFYEQMFGMKEVNHYRLKDQYDEPIMGFEDGAHVALFSPLAAAPLKKSQYPVAVLYTPDLDGVVKRLQEAKSPVQRLDAAQTGTLQIAITRDPSGNAIELVSRAGKWEVGGSKLIVDDRQKAEDFFTKVFGATAGRRYKTAAYDEVLMNFGTGPFLALFQPLSESPLPKSPYPVVAIYTSEFDAVLKRVTDAGLGYREVSSNPQMKIIVAKDPAGNAVEIIKRK
jgi:catechol 2,3-dioxygenase-like lactoylglutathione lyase family enzyme